MLNVEFIEWSLLLLQDSEIVLHCLIAVGMVHISDFLISGSKNSISNLSLSGCWTEAVNCYLLTHLRPWSWAVFFQFKCWSQFWKGWKTTFLQRYCVVTEYCVVSVGFFPSVHIIYFNMSLYPLFPFSTVNCMSYYSTLIKYMSLN